MDLTNIAMVIAPSLFISLPVRNTLDDVTMAAKTSHVVRLLIKYHPLLWTVSHKDNPFLSVCMPHPPLSLSLSFFLFLCMYARILYCLCTCMCVCVCIVNMVTSCTHGGRGRGRDGLIENSLLHKSPNRGLVSVCWLSSILIWLKCAPDKVMEGVPALNCIPLKYYDS